ncbi:hypothetical protein ACNOYE_31190 [Nannocystaceae bacterium ST9]
MVRAPPTRRIAASLVTFVLALALPISTFASPPETSPIEGPRLAPSVFASPPAPALAFMQPASPATSPDRPPEPRVRRNHGLGWTFLGFGMFGTTYVITASVGAMVIDNGYSRVGQAMLVPVAGPFIAASHTARASDGFMLASAGVFQVAGLAMGIAGAVMLAKARKAHRRVALGSGGLLFRF